MFSAARRGLYRGASLHSIPVTSSRQWRTFSASRARLSAEPSGQPTVLLSSPSPQYLEQEELDIELLPPQQVQMILTDRAAEQLRSISQREANTNAALRISVESGGCHGYQYKLELAKSRALDDYHLSHPSVQPSNILVDAVSLPLINGSTIDYATELIGSSFRVIENPHSKGNGCGCGVSWELKT